MNPLSLIVFVALLFLAWLGTNVLDKRERRRPTAVQGSHKSLQRQPGSATDPGSGAERSSRAVWNARMLSVGREANIGEKDVVCHACTWEGLGNRLSTGLVRIEDSRMFLYAYRCPVCGGFELSRKGKLLAFSTQKLLNQQQTAMSEERRAGVAEGSLSEWK